MLAPTHLPAHQGAPHRHGVPCVPSCAYPSCTVRPISHYIVHVTSGLPNEVRSA